MGFLAIIVATAVAALIIAIIFTMNSNYLDPNINPSLNITEELKLRGTFSPEDTKANNIILRKHLNIATKMNIILKQMEKKNKSNTSITPPPADRIKPQLTTSSSSK